MSPRKNTTISSGDTAHLSEFAQGEDVGHGVNHDCPACRINRQALKRAGLHASDVKGLEGGKPPAVPADPVISDHPENDPFTPPAPAQDILLGPGSNRQPNVSQLEDIRKRIGLPTCERCGRTPAHPECLSGRCPSEGSDLFGKAHTAEDEFAAGIGVKDLEPAATSNPATHFTPEDIERTEKQDQQALAVVDRHRRLLALSNKLELDLTEALAARITPDLFNAWNDGEIGIDELIIESSGRFMLMNGFIPEERDWHCEVGIGTERTHVAHPNRDIAIQLAVLMALDPKAAASLNSGIMQILQEERPTPRHGGHWVGTGVQPS